MDDKQRIKMAVLGCGHIGKRHAEMIRRNPEAELVALCDVQPKEKLGLAEDVPFFLTYRTRRQGCLHVATAVVLRSHRMDRRRPRRRRDG